MATAGTHVSWPSARPLPASASPSPHHGLVGRGPGWPRVCSARGGTAAGWHLPPGPGGAWPDRGQLWAEEAPSCGPGAAAQAPAPGSQPCDLGTASCLLRALRPRPIGRGHCGSRAPRAKEGTPAVVPRDAGASACAPGWGCSTGTPRPPAQRKHERPERRGVQAAPRSTPSLRRLFCRTWRPPAPSGHGSPGRRAASASSVLPLAASSSLRLGGGWRTRKRRGDFPGGDGTAVCLTTTTAGHRLPLAAPGADPEDSEATARSPRGTGPRGWGPDRLPGAPALRQPGRGHSRAVRAARPPTPARPSSCSALSTAPLRSHCPGGRYPPSMRLLSSSAQTGGRQPPSFCHRAPAVRQGFPYPLSLSPSGTGVTGM